MSPVSSISIAALRGTTRDRATIGVEQNRPTLMPETAKRAVSAAIAKSQVATSWQPAAVAMPCTRAITGTGRAGMRCIIRLHWANRSARAGPSAARTSRRSCPAQKPGPAPASTSTRTDRSSAMESNASSSAVIIAEDSALRDAGRFRVRVAMPSRSSRRTRGAFSDISAFRGCSHQGRLACGGTGGADDHAGFRADHGRVQRRDEPPSVAERRTVCRMRSGARSAARSGARSMARSITCSGATRRGCRASTAGTGRQCR